jgi:hypothetical protein
MALHITHHERVPGHANRWHVHVQGRPEPIPVELPEEERRSLEMTDEDIHALLPSALQAHARANRDDTLEGEEYQNVTWDSPVRVLQTHFMA